MAITLVLAHGSMKTVTRPSGAPTPDPLVAAQRVSRFYGGRACINDVLPHPWDGCMLPTDYAGPGPMICAYRSVVQVLTTMDRI
jgi:hypothetical protein